MRNHPPGRWRDLIASRLDPNLANEDLQLLQNTVDWSTEDASLLSIRASGATARVLEHLSQNQETGWEVGNYGFAVVMLALLAGIWQWRKRRRSPLLAVSGSTPSGRPVGDAS